jgi:hypothetical protein
LGNLEANLRKQREPFGWLLKRPEGWAVQFHSIPDAFDGSSLWTIAPVEGETTPYWLRIGGIESGSPKLNVFSFQGPAEGRPVFAEISSSDEINN